MQFVNSDEHIIMTIITLVISLFYKVKLSYMLLLYTIVLYLFIDRSLVIVNPKHLTNYLIKLKIVVLDIY